MLEHLGAGVVLLNLVDDEAGGHDGVAGEDTQCNQNIDQSAHPVGHTQRLVRGTEEKNIYGATDNFTMQSGPSAPSCCFPELVHLL